MLAGFENEVLKLPWVSIWRKFSQLFGGYLHCLPLAVFIEIGQLHADRERNFLLVHLFQQFRDEVGQANIALNLPAAVCIGNIILGLVANLFTSDSLMEQCFHFQLVSIHLFTGQDMLSV